jgi:hypothetical protein
MSDFAFEVNEKPDKVLQRLPDFVDLQYCRPVNFECRTQGGLWSRQTDKIIKHKKICLIVLPQPISQVYSNNPSRYSLDVFFDENDWNTKKDGLIYTDKLWLKDFKNNLLKIGFNSESLEKLSYSEQGLQGTNAVNLDAHESFAQKFFSVFYNKLYGFIKKGSYLSFDKFLQDAHNNKEVK